MKHIFYILLILIVHNTVNAGNKDKMTTVVKNVTGKVTATNGEEIAGVKITIKETNETFFSDLDGNFKLQIKTDMPYSISIESLGYAPLEVKSTDLGLFSDLNLKEL